MYKIYTVLLGTLLLPVITAQSALAEERLDEVVIVASKVEASLRETAVSISVINDVEINLRGYQSVADLLRTQPGVAVSNSGGLGKPTAIRIRGEEAYRTLLIVDGIDVSDPTGTQSGAQPQHLMSSNNIQQIEILRGPQGLMYGADAGGVVNVRTRSAGQEMSGEVSMEVGRYNTRFLNGYVTAVDDALDVFVSISDSKTDGFDLFMDDGGTSIVDNDGYENTTLHSKFGLALSPQVKLNLVLRNTESTNEYDRCGWGAAQSNDCIGVFDQVAGRLSLVYSGSSIESELGIQRLETDRGGLNQGLSDFATKGEMNKFEYLANWSLSDMYSLGWGVDFEQEEVVAVGGDLYQRYQTGGFSEFRMNLADTVYTTAGIRFDDSEDFGQHASVRVSAAYIQALSQSSSLKYRTSYGTGYRAPSLSEIAHNAKGGPSSPQLSEELSSGYDVGVEFYQNNGISVQLTYFNQMIEDEISYVHSRNLYEQAMGISHSKGVELAAELPLFGHWSVFGNYTYNETLTRDDLRRTRRPRNIVNLGLKFSSLNQALNVLVSSRYVRDAIDEFYDDAIDSTVRGQLGDYRVVDASVNYTLNNDATIFARVENAFDEKYQEVTDYRVAEQAFYVGLKISI